MKPKDKSILMLVQYPEHVSPGQRFRFELYKDVLLKHDFSVTTRSFLGKKGYSVIHKEGHVIAKIIAILQGFCNRVLVTFTLGKYSYIFLQREVAPLGPPFFEWLYSRVLKKKIVYDFDDAIWIPYVSEQNSLGRLFKNPGKVKKICSWVYKVSCGNAFLCNFATQYNPNVVYNPTCVDTLKYHNILTDHNTERIRIGWTGSFSTIKYLSITVPALQKLQEKYDFDIRIICNEKPVLQLKNVEYVEWAEENEVEQLAGCHIGLMPLTQDEWSEGKCAFKLIQYLALEIPAVSSPVGVNKIIIEEGINGFFANSDEEWYQAIEKLMLDTQLRKRLGKAGRVKIVEQFSVQSNEQNFVSLFS